MIQTFQKIKFSKIHGWEIKDQFHFKTKEDLKLQAQYKMKAKTSNKWSLMLITGPILRMATRGNLLEPSKVNLHFRTQSMQGKVVDKHSQLKA